MTTTTDATTATDAEIDEALLSVLRAAPGGSMAWADLRARLPLSPYWARVESLTRLKMAGALDVWKDDEGRNYVSIALTPAARHRP